MQVKIFQKYLKLTEDQESYILEKIDHLKHLEERVNDESTSVRVDVEENRIKTTNKNISMQVTMYLPHSVIRAEVLGLTIEEAIDVAVEKLRKQIERYKGKKNRRDKAGKWIPVSTLETISGNQEGAGNVPSISKRKKFDDVRPMHEEEAIEQMELLGHDFYAFMNSDTDTFNIVYRRNDGSYGLLEF